MEGPTAAPPTPVAGGAGIVAGWVRALPGMIAGCTDDVARVDLIAALETAKGAMAGGQAELTHAFRLSQIGDTKGRTQQRLHRSVCGQIGLARRESPHRGGRHVGLAKALHDELPHTRAALNAGRITEWQATVVCRETACLDPQLRLQVDQWLAPQLGQVGDQSLAATAARLVAEVDAAAVAARAAKAAKDRRVSVRPAPDSMCYLTSLLPVAVGVAAYAALNAAATAVIATPGGDPGIDPDPAAKPRGRGQIMADLLVQRLTAGAVLGSDQYGAPLYPARPDTDSDDHTAGTDPTSTGKADTPRPASAGTDPADAPADEAGDMQIHLHIVLSDASLFGWGNEPAEVLGYGPIPAELAGRIAAAGLDRNATTWFRRFYTAPDTGQLAAMDAKARHFPDTLKEFLLVRDRRCRIPYCDAPARHADHVHDHALGGPTSAGNGQMTSADCNFTKQAPGWTHTAHPDGTITVTTPTGHQHHSRPPTPPGQRRYRPRPRPDTSYAERRLAQVLLYDPAA